MEAHAKTYSMATAVNVMNHLKEKIVKMRNKVRTKAFICIYSYIMCYITYFPAKQINSVGNLLCIWCSHVAECGGHPRGLVGTLSFPNQMGANINGQGMDCVYTIGTEAGKIMNISFTQLNLKRTGYYCTSDWLEVK